MSASTEHREAASLGAAAVLTADADRRFFSQDIAGPRAHVAACVIQPESVEQLAAAVSAATAAGFAVVPRGSDSSYTGGYVPPHDVRTAFWGPLSGATATVGSSLSQNAILWGSARYGVSAGVAADRGDQGHRGSAWPPEPRCAGTRRRRPSVNG